MGKYEGLARDILKNVGGRENIDSVRHCITRLRFYLKDESKANDDVLKKMDGVVTVMKSAGQYQVVIGNHVPHVYEELVNLAGLSQATNSSEKGEKKLSVFNQLIDILSGVFQPFLGVLAASGMLKGFLALAFSLNLISQTSDTYVLLNQIGSAIFYFFPIIIGFTAAKKFKLTPVLGMVLGMALVLPTLQLSTFQEAFKVAEKAPEIIFQGTIFESQVYMKLFGVIPVILNNYTSTVVPIIFIVAFAAVVERFSKKIIPELIQTFFVPFTVLLISLPVGFIVIGPITSILTNILQEVLIGILAFSPILYGLTLGVTWQILVIFGLHWAIAPVYYMQLAQFGQSQVLTPMFTASFAQTAVILAMFFKLKDKKLKTLAIPAFISGIMGVTEPAIYGLSLPKKKPFYYSLIGAGIGGAMMMSFNITAFRTGGIGIFGLFNYISEDGSLRGVWLATIAVAVASVIGFVLTMLFWKDDYVEEEEDDQVQAVKSIKSEEVLSPLSGQVIKLEDVKDEAFALGILGQGLAILPNKGEVTAPFDGEVTMIFPTKHAIGLTSNGGIELLIHIGLDTVQLEGKHFEAFVKNGDKIKAGQKLITFDIDKIKADGYSIETPVIVTNKDDYREILPVDKKDIDQGQALIHTVNL